MTFTIQHFIALLPLLITSATLVVVMLAVASSMSRYSSSRLPG